MVYFYLLKFCLQCIISIKQFHCILIQGEMEAEVEKVKIISLFNKEKNKEDRYMLSLQVIGEGKYGKVYKAVHVDKPDTIFAVKVIKLSSQKVKTDCLKELQIIQHLPKCINLVKIHPQHIQSANNFYIFEEYCDGGTLYDEKNLRKNNSFSQEEVFNIFYQVTNGFIALRRAGIFHEDIKPQNILKKNNLYKITDFGISQLDHPQESSVIRKGTLIYMPPEKLKNQQYNPTSKSQIFSLGITFYEVFFGHPPFLVKKPANYKEYLKMIAEAKVKTIDELKKCFKNSSLRMDKLIRIILKMIQLNQMKRLSLDELIDYVENTEPFKSMKITENFEGVKKKQFSDKKKYEFIAQSKIYVSQAGHQSISAAFKVQQEQDYEAILEVLRLYLQFFKNVLSYLQQGISYCKQTNLYQLKQPYTQKNHTFKQKVEYLNLLSAYYTDFIFSEIKQKYYQILCAMPITEQEMIDLQFNISDDSEFVKNQFLKVYTETDLDSKKNFIDTLKEQGTTVGLKLSTDLRSIYKEIDCIRINFKQDILTLLFLKSVSSVLEFTNSSLNLFLAYNKKELATQLVHPHYDSSLKIMADFSRYESIQRNKLQKIVQDQMKGQQQILYDIQSNSDEFEVLEFEED